MKINFDDVNQLEYRGIREGEIWIYSADFNNCKKYRGSVKSGTTDRADAEIDDLKQILKGGGRVAILAHKGRYKDGDTDPLDFVAPYLSKRLRARVSYFDDNTSTDAINFVKELRNGEAAIMGNTRMNSGEEENHIDLAEAFSYLGERAAIGGFGKAHRAHASNVGILDHVPGYATRSQLREMVLLEPWAGEDEAYSVAVLGGVKGDKITTGLKGFVRSYNYIIPGGIVLNTILKVLGHEIGGSLIEDRGKTFEKEAAEILNEYAHKISIPSRIVIARKEKEWFVGGDVIDIARGVPKDYMIVDFVVPDYAVRRLEVAAVRRGKILLAGTPGIYRQGFKTATDTAMYFMQRPGVRGLVLGGDTANDVKFDGTISTGGGSALAFLVDGTTDVFEALKKNKQAFEDV